MYFRVVDGRLTAGDDIRLMNTQKEFEVLDVGVLAPKPIEAGHQMLSESLAVPCLLDLSQDHLCVLRMNGPVAWTHQVCAARNDPARLHECHLVIQQHAHLLIASRQRLTHKVDALD